MFKNFTKITAIAAVTSLGASQAHAFAWIPFIATQIVANGIAAANANLSGVEVQALAALKASSSTCRTEVKVGATCNFTWSNCSTSQQWRADAVTKIREVSSISNGGGTTVKTDEYEVRYTLMTKCEDDTPDCNPESGWCWDVVYWNPNETFTARGLSTYRLYDDPPNFNFNFGNSGSKCSYCTGDDKDG